MSRKTDFERAYIFAGTQREAIAFMQARNLSWRQVVLVDNPDAIRGCIPAVVYCVGTFRHHPRFLAIETEMAARGIRKEVMP